MLAFRRSLRLQILALLTLALMPVGILALTNAVYSYRNFREALEMRVSEAAELVAAEQDAILRQGRTVVEALSALGDLAPADHGECKQDLLDASVRWEQISNISVIGPDGSIYCSARPVTIGSKEIRRLVWFQRLHDTKGFFLDRPVLAGSENENLIVLAGKISGSSDAIVAMGIKIATMRESLDRLNIPEGAAVAIINAEGKPILERANGNKPGEWLPEIINFDQKALVEAGLFRAHDKNGVLRRYRLAQILDGAGFAVLSIPAESIRTVTDFFFYSGVALPVLMWLTALITAHFSINRMVVRPLTTLRRTIDAYSKGKQSVRVPELKRAPGEVRDVAVTFNKMADTIEKRDNELRVLIEKERALTREIHHRIKNNLQITSSLLNLQAKRAVTEREQSIFFEVQQRISALSLIHAELYNSDDIRYVDLGSMVRRLCVSTAQGLRDSGSLVNLDLDVSDIMVLTDTAVPLALLIAELLHYAALQELEGEDKTDISVELKESGKNIQLTLSCSSSFASGIETSTDTSISAITLINGLVKQLSGRYVIKDEGRTFEVLVPEPGQPIS